MDENIPNVTVDALRAAGHNVFEVRGTPQQGMFDDQLWPLVQKEERMLITTDKEFSEHRADKHHGVLIIHLRQPNEQRIHTPVMAAFEQFAADDWSGLLVVMRDVVQSVQRAT